MTRSKTWPVVVVALAAATLAVVGCRGGRTHDSAPASGRTGGGADARAKLFANWPRPAAALIITGEQLGYLAPCGCTRGQKGGLIRRQVLIERLRAQGWPLALVDLGSLINDPHEHGERLETTIRYSIALKALELLKYDALAFSAHDLKLGTLEVAGQLTNLGDRPRVVAANLTPDPQLGLEGKVVPSVRVAAGPVKVGVTAVVDPQGLKEVKDPEAQSLLATKPPESVLPAILADLEKDTTVQVLLVQGPPEAARRLARDFPGFEVVVSTSPYVDPSKEQSDQVLNDGKTRLVMVEQKGQAVGVLGLYPGGAPATRYAVIELIDRFDKDPALAKLGEPMRVLLDETFPAHLKAANVLQDYPRRPYKGPDGAESTATYVGAETCKGCHAESYRIWARTPHAKAYRGLTEPKRNREWDAECVRCHTTGFEYVGGYTTPEATPQLKGNQCENCHGPGSQHAADPDNAAYRKALARSKADWEHNHRCLTCHDADNDTDFDFARDWAKIEHTAVDDYADPKVHRGVAPRVVGTAR